MRQSAPPGNGRQILPLSRRLAERIRSEGPLRFDEFQAAALYDGEGGYYERPGRIGREGDFVTGSSWHPAFARCLVRIASRVAEQRGGIDAVDVVDAGAGEGELLAFLAVEAAAVPLRLHGVELSGRRRAVASARAPGAALHRTIEELPAVIDGLVVAYELFDALPVRALRMADGGGLVERAVTVSGEGVFDWCEVPCGDGGEIVAFLGARGASLQPGQLLEIRPGAVELARALARRLRSGLLLVFDYGAPARALYGPARLNGTLEAFQSHTVSRDVLTEPGSRDITAWVDFTELSEALVAEGLTVHGLVSQSRVLAAAGITAELARDEPAERVTAARLAERNAVAKLFAPGGMGELIRVLVAERGTAVGASLVRFPEGAPKV